MKYMNYMKNVEWICIVGMPVILMLFFLGSEDILLASVYIGTLLIFIFGVIPMIIEEFKKNQ